MKLLTTIILLLIIASCNPAKQVLKNQQAFEQIGNEWARQHPCANDSVTVFLPGRIDSIFQTVPVKDAAALQHLSDSVSKALAEKYHQDINDCNRQVNEALNTGYDKALYDLSKKKVADKKPDTIKVLVADTRAINALKATNAQLVKQVEDAEDRIDHFKEQRNIAYIITALELLLLLALGYILIRIK